MSNSKRTIAADLESPFLDQQIIGPDPTPEATDYLESGEDEGTLDEEEQAEDSEAESAEEMEAFWRAESGTTEEAERDDAESEDEEPEISEACEEEQENSDEGAEAEWEDLEDTADEAAASEPELLDSEVWSGTADQNAFRDRVLAAHIARSKAAGGAPQRDLRRDELKAIPRTSIETRADTADAAGRLLAAANADLAAAQKAGDADARRTVRLTATSGYRSSAYQSDLWRQYFSAQGGYYDRTQDARQAIPEGRHSDEAVAYMLKRKKDGGFGLGGRIAAPGYSNHQGGIAVDFFQERTKGNRIANKSDDASRRRWRNTWFHKWLKTNAATYDFAPISTEEWHWEYRPSATSAARAQGGPSIPVPPAPETRSPVATPSAELVRFAQRVLNATEGERLDDDGDLGRLTRGALERFRKRYGLGTTGVIDAKTEIALTQRALEEIAQQSMFPQSGVLDAKTRDALTAFKASHGLAFGPTLDAPTRKALTDALAKRASLSKPRPSGSSAAARPSMAKDGSVHVEHVPYTGKIRGLEKGVKVKTTLPPFRPDVSDRRDLAIAATGAAEGGFDTVNMYDKGILSWGMMQWTLHQGSLQKALSFINERLTAQGKSSLWSSLFGGLELRNNEIVYQGELLTTKNNSRLREIFRGSAKPNEYDRTVAEHWAHIFARAGRDPVIQTLQTAYARKEVDALLEMSLGASLAALRRRCSKRPEGGTWKYVCPRLTQGPEVYVNRYRRVGDYVGTVLKTLALVFGMKVNNPTGAFVHLMLAVDALAAKYSTHDIDVWPAGWQVALSDELERILLASGFATWGDAKAKRAKRVSRTRKILLGLKKHTSTV